ncbi:MAG: pilus assembly protein PilM [Bacteriovoracaceae bacterium]
MHILAIDVGSYSIKYISSFIDRRKITHVDMSEVIISDYLEDHPAMPIRDAQMNIVQDVLANTARPDTRIIFQADNEMMTTRFLELPVKNRKKADLMLPFQLEEDIPYALSEIHFAYRLEGQKNSHHALVELIRETDFEPYYGSLKERDILPTILTTEASVMENYFHQNAIAGPFCVVNLGHKTTRAYFFFNSRLLATHVSYVGGDDVNEMISETYKIDPTEAIIYKHQNAFFLTANQYGEVDEAQREFASSMDKVFQPLVSDFSRWRIGFKVNFNLTINHVFICGGTSNIKNIANYLTEKWDTKVTLLESFDKIESEKVDLNAKNKSKFALVNMMALGFKRKNRFINLLTGRFAQTSLTEIPLHSMAFLGVRVGLVTLLFVMSLFLERFFLNRDIQTLNARLTTTMKNDELAIPPRLRRQLLTNPRPILDSLNKRARSVKQEISTLQSAVEIKALAPLVTVAQIVANSPGVTMTQFVNDNSGTVTAHFEAEEVKDLVQLQTALESGRLTDARTQLDEKNKKLTLTAQGN